MPTGKYSSPRRILVTGGAGFLGSHLCQRLIERGDDVVCVDNFFTGAKQNVSHLLGNPRFELIRHDITFPLYIEVDEIYNLACPASPIHYQHDPVQTTKTSVHGAINMLGLAKRCKAKILQASTSEVYGDPEVHPQKEDYWGRVNPIGLRSCYDEGKRCAETLFFDYHRQHKLLIKVVRIFNTYGPRMHPNDGRVASNFIMQALTGQDLTIYGNGQQTRSFCYVDDLVEAMIRMMDSPDDITGPINLGNPEEFTMLELAEQILQITGAKSRIVYRPLPSDDPRQRKPDIDLAKNLLNWEPKVPLSEGLLLTVNYFRRQFPQTESAKIAAQGGNKITAAESGMQEQLRIQAIELQSTNPPLAKKIFHQLLESNPNDLIALYSLAVMAINSGEAELGVTYAEKLVKGNPNYGPSQLVLASALHKSGKHERALNSYNRALELTPDSLDVLINRGTLLREMGRHKDALESMQQAISVDPNCEHGLCNYGILLSEFKLHTQAIAAFQRLEAINPRYPFIAGLHGFERLHICDWTNFAATQASVVRNTRAMEKSCKALAFMAYSDSAEYLLKSSIILGQHLFPERPESPWTRKSHTHDRIRIAYVSPDFRQHPVGHLMAGVIEHHDRNKFEVIGISLGVNDESETRIRFEKGFDRFVDVRTQSSDAIVSTMRELEVDIAIDLAGYTADSRTEVFAKRCAPIQVNYLGYAGSMGRSYYDYIIADKHVIPESHKCFYTEKVIWLPNSYMPTDDSISVSKETPTRKDAGLPDTGFVFCSFNHDYKITPPLFDTWMRILKRVDDSVLWLMTRNPETPANLRREAHVRGIDGERLLFASRVPRVEDHLARYRLAGLFLDTTPYNAHTTAADALMAGLPVLTCMGSGFPSRVAGSLVTTAGLTELITHNLRDYEELAVQLAFDADRLNTLTEKLRNGHHKLPLFNTANFTRGIESAYGTLWNRQKVGLPPEAFEIANNS
jgi:predicted O-linked N-acetylglucosamine transferase (SPINDLY family)/nucleoside-diphosphate-sugar epimerase